MRLTGGLPAVDPGEATASRGLSEARHGHDPAPWHGVERNEESWHPIGASGELAPFLQHRIGNDPRRRQGQYLHRHLRSAAT
jgi:hypothetical protein